MWVGGDVVVDDVGVDGAVVVVVVSEDDGDVDADDDTKHERSLLFFRRSHTEGGKIDPRVNICIVYIV